MPALDLTNYVPWAWGRERPTLFLSGLSFLTCGMVQVATWRAGYLSLEAFQALLAWAGVFKHFCSCASKPPSEKL